MGEKKYDFTGYATKNGIKCADGRVIMKDAFKDQNGARVPLVWQHFHDDPDNVLGHVDLENRDDGVYCRGSFNNSDFAQHTKELVQHGDITSLSIYANQLQEAGKNVTHGMIREVSLVLAGANPGARIDNVSFAHSDGTSEEDESEVVIMMGGELEHSAVPKTTKKEIPPKKEDIPPDDGSSDDNSDETVEDVFNTMNEKQKTVVYALIAQALDSGSDDNSDDNSDSAQHSDDGEDGNNMKHNVFDRTMEQDPNKHVLSHDQIGEILGDAKRFGSLKESFIAHTADYGFEPIDVLFPDAKYANQNGPDTLSRDQSWAQQFLNEANHTPFARIKTAVADITADDARAKGYVTGHLKKEEVIALLKRSTNPTTIYKKQKLDRDDITDITDFDVVVWLKNEMRGMLNEELARAILIGDGRDAASEDKVDEQCIRPIVKDSDNMYVVRATVEAAAKTDDIIDEFIRSRKDYKGTGTPTLYTSTNLLTEMLLVKDTTGRRIYGSVAELASVLRVSKIVEVELLNGATRKVDDTHTNNILGVVVNMADYTIGSDKGGDIGLFDDFDIDYNQYKYLIETRVSGALTRPKSAIVLEQPTA